MKLIFTFGNVLFAYTQNMMWWGTIKNISIHIDGRVLDFEEYLENIKRLG